MKKATDKNSNSANEAGKEQETSTEPQSKSTGANPTTEANGANETNETNEANEANKTPSYEEVLDTLKRTQANFENYRKQTDQRISEIRKFATKSFVVKLLPSLDAFELALKSTSKKSQTENPNLELANFIEGVKMIQSQMLSTLNAEGVKQINKIEKFDPKIHEPVQKIPSDSVKEGEIIEFIQSGYELNGQIIRAARVIVSSGKDEN